MRSKSKEKPAGRKRKGGKMTEAKGSEAKMRNSRDHTM